MYIFLLTVMDRLYARCVSAASQIFALACHSDCSCLQTAKVSAKCHGIFFFLFFSSHPTRKFTVASFTFSAHYQCEQRSPLCLPRVIQVTFGVCLLCGYVICADMTCIKGQHCLWAWRLKRSAWDSKLFQLCYGLETILFRHFDQFSSGPVSKCNVCGIHSICSII